MRQRRPAPIAAWPAAYGLAQLLALALVRAPSVEGLPLAGRKAVQQPAQAPTDGEAAPPHGQQDNRSSTPPAIGTVVGKEDIKDMRDPVGVDLVAGGQFLRTANGTVQQFSSCNRACDKCFADHYQGCLAFCRVGCEDYCVLKLPRPECEGRQEWVAHVAHVFQALDFKSRMCLATGLNGCPPPPTLMPTPVPFDNYKADQHVKDRAGRTKLQHDRGQQPPAQHGAQHGAQQGASGR